MPDWISSAALKILSSEKTVKVMLTIVIWALFVLFTPESFTSLITTKSGIPFSGQVALFALAFVISEVMTRLLTTTNKTVSKAVNSSKEDRELFNKISSLGAGEKQILRMIVSSGEGSAFLNQRDENVITLSQKRIITCIHVRRVFDDGPRVGYRINDKYIKTSNSYFSKCN